MGQTEAGSEFRICCLDQVRPNSQAGNFLGFRKDKKAIDVVREVPKRVQVIEEEEQRYNEQTATTKKSL